MSEAGQGDEGRQGRRDAGQRLRLLEAALSASGEGVIITDAQGRLLSMNQASRRLVRHAPEPSAPVVGALPLRYPDGRPIPPEDTPLSRALRGEEARRFLLLLTSPDGTDVYIENTASPVRDERGNLMGTVAILHDVTEEKRAEEALRERERESRTLLNHMPDIIARFDRNMRYTFVSAGVQRATGVNPETYLGQTPRETGLFDEATLEAFERYSRRAFETGEVQVFEHPVVEPSGIHYYLVRVVPELDAQGSVVSLLNISQDVTERRQAEAERERLLKELRGVNERLLASSLREQELADEARRRAGQAEEALHLRDEFLSLAAHELKTPLTSLKGYAELAMRRIERGGLQDPEQIRHTLEVIDHQVDKFSALIAQILDIQGIEAGQLGLERQVTDLVPLARRVVEGLQAGTNKHALSLHAPPSLKADVDPLRLEQILYSLLDNAIRYSPQGGPIEVDISTPDAGTVRIAVRDHGIGIPPEQREQLFTRFYQASRRPAGGLGLGLYSSRRLVELHGGRIWAEFPADGGSLFVVELPRDGDEGTHGN